jgi:hypothetical protein
VHDEEPRRLPQGWRLIGGVVVLLLAYGAYHLLSADRESGQAVPPPPVMAPPRQVAAAPKPPAPVEQATPSPAIDATGTPAPGGAVPSPAMSSPPASAAPSQPAAMPSPASGAAVAPTGKVYGEANKNARVVLRARGLTHITVKGRDGTTWINRNLNSGDTYQVPNAVGLTLSTSNGGAVEVDLDGLAMGNAGEQMQPADDMPLDPQSIVDHFNSRRPG